MERRKVIKRKTSQSSQLLNHKMKHPIINHSKELLKHPGVKAVAVVGILYGILFVSKYVIKEYAEVVAATKKLRDAHRL